MNKKGEEIMYDIESKINFSGNFFHAAASATNKQSFACTLDSSLCNMKITQCSLASKAVPTTTPSQPSPLP